MNKELLLKEAWKKSKKEKIQLNNKTIYFDHDYTAEVVKKRREYNGIKKASESETSLLSNTLCKYADLLGNGNTTTTALRRRERR